MSDWVTATRRVETEAYFPEIGEKIATLNGVETANANTVVIRHRANEDEPWHVLVTDMDTFQAAYDCEFLDTVKDNENEETADSESEDEAADNSEAQNAENQETVDYNEFTMDGEDGLRELCRKRDLSPSGTKAELVARLEEYDRSHES